MPSLAKERVRTFLSALVCMVLLEPSAQQDNWSIEQEIVKHHHKESDMKRRLITKDPQLRIIDKSSNLLQQIAIINKTREKKHHIQTT